MALLTVIPGGTHADVRGKLRFCNDFDMSAVKRFYTVANSHERPVRGWIGHKRETKWFFPVKGETCVVVEPMTNASAKNPSQRKTFLLKADTPDVLKVEPGNWFSIKQDGNAEVMVFSDCKLCECENDDFRRPL